MQSHPRQVGSSDIVDSSDKNGVHWREEREINPVFSPEEHYEWHEKAKRFDTGR